MRVDGTIFDENKLGNLSIGCVVRAHLVSQDYGRIVHIWLGSAHCIDYDYVPM